MMLSLRLSPWTAPLLLALIGAGCGDDTSNNSSSGAGGEGGGSGGAGGSGGGGPVFPEAICNAGTTWSAGRQAFQEVTSAWGLIDAGVVGVRLAAVDIDGDGYADLAVRRGGPTPDDFGADGTRQTWLLKNQAGGGFEDVTVASDIRQTRYGSNADEGRPGEVFAFADVDNDGDIDVFTGLLKTPDNPSDESSELLLNNGDGTFSLGPEENDFRDSGPGGIYDSVAGAAFVDYDRDGNVDLFVSQNSVNFVPLQDRLFRGDGTGKFTDVTEDVGLITSSWGVIDKMNAAEAHSNAWSALACDLDGDGNSELLAASYGRAPNHLWHHNGNGFDNASVASGYAFDHRTDWSDNESARCHCQLHPTDPDCAGVPAPELIPCNTDDDAFRWNHGTDREPYRLGGNSGSTVCADINNDGQMDLLTTEIVHWDVGQSSDPSELLINQGDMTFDRPGNEVTGLEREHVMVAWNDGDMTGAAFDFDNDGYKDIYVGASDYPGNHGLLFRQIPPSSSGGTPTFEAVPIAEGIDHTRSHGVAVADFDRDGDLDIAVGHSRARCDAGLPDNCYETAQVRLFENVVGDGGNFLQLDLRGADGTNRSAIGARVTVETEKTTQTFEVGGGHGHYGIQHDLVVHAGLGSACEATVTVRWPDGELTSESYVMPAGYRFSWTQGEDPAALEE